MEKIICGDSLQELKKLEDNSIDSVVTDPPYGLTSITKRFGKKNSAETKYGNDGSFQRLSKGFMGKEWDGSGIEYNIDLWKEVLRVLKPGGYLLSFGACRTYHRMACAVEDAGFEIRDCIFWCYGSGFPKSLNIHKKDNRCPDYLGTALKPAVEPICMARKPLSEKSVALNVLKWGTGGINVDECRVETDWSDRPDSWKKSGFGKKQTTSMFGIGGTGIDTLKGRFPANLIHDGSDEVVKLFPNTKSGKMTPNHKRHTNGSPNGIYGKFDINYKLGETYGDSGSAARFFYCAKSSKSERNKGLDNLIIINLTICEENMEMAQSLQRVISELTEKWLTELFGKELMEKFQMDFEFITKMETNKIIISVTLNSKIRWNIKEYILDAIKMNSTSDENLVENVENSSELKQIITKGLMEYLLDANPVVSKTQLKISVSESNIHNTVKPITLLRYLCRLVTPKGGTVLDPFMGSGSTGIAAKLEGFNFIGIEIDPEYVSIANARIAGWEPEPEQKPLIK